MLPLKWIFLLLSKSTDLVIPIYPIVISSINSVSKMYLVQLDIEKISLIVSLSLNVWDLQQYFDQALFSGEYLVLSGVRFLFDLCYKVLIYLVICC